MNQEPLIELKRRSISAGLQSWSVYFNKKLNKDLAKMYGQILLPYSLKTIDTVIEQILKQGEKFPSFANLKATISTHEVMPTAYNKKTDTTYPVAKMHEGLSLLLEKGKDAFDEFCQRTGMPLDDIDRVSTRAGIISTGSKTVGTPHADQGQNRRHTHSTNVGQTDRDTVVRVKALSDQVGIHIGDHVKDQKQGEIPF